MKCIVVFFGTGEGETSQPRAAVGEKSAPREVAAETEDSRRPLWTWFIENPQSPADDSDVRLRAVPR